MLLNILYQTKETRKQKHTHLKEKYPTVFKISKCIKWFYKILKDNIARPSKT